VIWRDEEHLWGYLKPRMRGKWWRLEASCPDGLTDSMGLWQGQTHWLEHKIGRPSVQLLRPAQRTFALECRDHGVPWYACFGYRGNAWFYDFNGLLTNTAVTPPFWVSPSEALRLPREKAVGEA